MDLNARAEQFGLKHPLATVAIVSVPLAVLAGVVALALGRHWHDASPVWVLIGAAPILLLFGGTALLVRDDDKGHSWVWLLMFLSPFGLIRAMEGGHGRWLVASYGLTLTFLLGFLVACWVGYRIRRGASDEEALEKSAAANAWVAGRR